MTPRERFLTAVERKEPDRVPISFGGTLSTGILECPPSGRTYSKLCHDLGIDDFEPPDIGHLGNFVGNIDERVMNRFGSDFRRIDPNPQPVLEEADGSKTLLGTLCGLRVKRSGYYDDVFEFPLQNSNSLGDLRSYPFWPGSEDFKRLARGKCDEAVSLRRTTDFAIVVDTLLSFPFLMYSLLAGYERWFLDMKLNPRFYFALSDKLLEVGFGIVDSFVGAVGDCIDMVCTYDDLGTQEGLFCSINDYRKYIQPYEKQMIEHLRKRTAAKVYRHCCGSIYEMIPLFIDMGVEILNPLQPRARNMEPWRLKKEFGGYLAFFGGTDTQDLLPHGTPAEVRQVVAETIRTYGQGGGYIFGTATNIEPDTPVENIVAMFEAAQTWGVYPIQPRGP